MSSISEISDGQALQALISANKSLKDHSSLANFIRQVLSAPGIFVFGELFDLDTIQSVCSPNDGAGRFCPSSAPRPFFVFSPSGIFEIFRTDAPITKTIDGRLPWNACEN
jgi:hypothetical protein